ncbi:YecA family protein [Vibrio sp.]|uniref:YecA/YgfB family protein n=1 Tax=Vibrio sp. TaxID=678 RepID=UPI003D14D770
MSDKQLPEYSIAFQQLQSAGLAVTPAEMHGLLCGMLSGGMAINDDSWQPLLFDYTNDGMGWPDNALQMARQALTVSTAELTGSAIELSMLLPGDEQASLFERADALSEWVNHYFSGMGLVAAKLDKVPQDVQEAMADLEEIARLGIDEDDDLQEQAQLLEQVIEHVKACVLTIHAELGAKPTQPSKPTLH